MLATDEINLDYIANCPVNTEISKIMEQLMQTTFNPQSNHVLGQKSKKIIESYTKKVIDSFPEYKYIEFVPGGGSNANKRAIFSCFDYKPRTTNGIKRDIIIVSSIEHFSLYAHIPGILTRLGFEIIYLQVTKHGVIDIDNMKKTLEEYGKRTAIVSIMNVNNETGIIQPLSDIIEIIKSIDNSIIIHSDISQGIGLFIQENKSPDIISMSIYKLNGPHYGVVLYKNQPLFNDYFGTPDSSSIVGSSIAIMDYLENYKTIDHNNKIIKTYTELKLDELFKKCDYDYILISNTNSVNNIVSFLIPGVQTSLIQQLLSEKNICIGTGSACQSSKSKGSHVVLAMGYSIELSFSLMRLSFSSNYLKMEHVDIFIKEFDKILCDLKNIANQNINVEQKIKSFNKLSDIVVSISEKQYIGNLNYDYLRIMIGESFLKGNNRALFLKKICFDIRARLGQEFKVITMQTYILVKLDHEYELKNPDLVNIINKLKFVPGIYGINPVITIKYQTFNHDIINNILAIISYIYEYKNPNSFKINTRVSNITNFMNKDSIKWNIIFGKYITNNFGSSKVNLSNPELTITINMGDTIMIWIDTILGLSGLPLGSEGNAAVILDKNNINRSIEAIICLTIRGVIVNCYSDYDLALVKNNVNIYNPGITYKIGQKIVENIIIHEPDDMFDPNNIVEYVMHLKNEKKMITCLTGLDDFKTIQQKLINKNIVPIYCDKLDKNINSNPRSVLSLLSGGIDSPVASKIMIQNNIQTHFIHFTADINKIDKIIDIRNKISANGNGELYVIEFKKLQDTIVNIAPESYRTIMYKVFMILIANKIAKQIGAGAIVTGNSWGQVASQTAENLLATDFFSELPIISPLLVRNKDDIIKMAREIDTYNYSICQGTNDCCIMYLPKFPVIKSSIKTIEKIINRIPNYIDLINIIKK